MRALVFGEVLFDRFPDGSAVLGGAPFNVAWHLQAFGLKPLMVSRIGRDDEGERVLEAMSRWGMDTRGMQIDPAHPTGRVQVAFEDGEPHYDIVDNVAFDHISASNLPVLEPKRWLLYHGSLAVRRTKSAAALKALREGLEGPRFLDVNLRPPWWTRQEIVELVEGADWIKLNGDELRTLFPDRATHTEQIGALTGSIGERIILTNGAQGASAIGVKDAARQNVVPKESVAVIDTVGAGDAFCSVVLAGNLLDWPIDVSLNRAQEFASAIVGLRGAVTDDKAFYGQFIDAWNIG